MTILIFAVVYTLILFKIQIRHFVDFQTRKNIAFWEVKTLIMKPENDIPNCVVLLKSHQKGMASIWESLSEESETQMYMNY